MKLKLKPGGISRRRLTGKEERISGVMGTGEMVMKEYYGE
jgi:hypothetical protein